MTKVLKLVVAGLFALSLAACAIDGEDYAAGATYTENARLLQNSSVCFDTASYLLERLEVILDADGGYHWGIGLHGPVVIADAITRYAVANMPDTDGDIFTRHGDFYVGKLPEDVLIGNTASYFDGRLWGMVTWGLVEANADNLDVVLDTMLHELFHAQQPYIFKGTRALIGINPPHMRVAEVRINVRLEINALLHALRSTGDERLAAVYDALSIRAERRRNNDEIAAIYENSLEILEGTAVYTEAAMGRNNLGDRIALVEWHMDSSSNFNIVDQSGYFSGALYSLLLSEFAADWRASLSWDCDLAELLKAAVGFTEIIPFHEIDLERYDYSRIRLFEEAWAAETERLTEMAWDALSGPLLLIDAMGEFGQGRDEDVRLLFLQDLPLGAYDEFDYGQEDIYPISGERTVFYGDFTYAAEFGELEVTGGVLMLWRVMWRHGIPAYDIEVDGNRVIAPSWVLTLNEGFALREVGGGHFAIGR